MSGFTHCNFSAYDSIPLTGTKNAIGTLLTDNCSVMIGKYQLTNLLTEEDTP